MQTAILVLHIIVCLVIIVLVLLQAGREGLGAVFGGAGNSSVFGSAGAGGILVKLTAFLAVLFVVTSLSYNVFTSSANKSAESVLNVQFEEVAPVEAPATPAPSTPAETVAPVEKTEPTPAETVTPAEKPAPANNGTEEAASQADAQ